MKDFKLPITNEEERQKQWDSLKPNDKLISFNRGGWDNGYYIKYNTVIKKTPTGSVRLDNGELLKVFYPKYYIDSEEIQECIKKIELEDEIMNLLFNIDRHKRDFKANLSYENAIKLKEILKEIKI